jgi:hypothetical protein
MADELAARLAAATLITHRGGILTALVGTGSLTALPFVDVADDVIRAWDLPDAMFAVGGSLALAVTVAGVVRHLSGNASEHHSPHARRSAQPLLMGSGVVLIGVGLLLWMAGMGWGLRSPEGCSSARG